MKTPKLKLKQKTITKWVVLSSVFMVVVILLSYLYLFNMQINQLRSQIVNLRTEFQDNVAKLNEGFSEFNEQNQRNLIFKQKSDLQRFNEVYEVNQLLNDKIMVLQNSLETTIMLDINNARDINSLYRTVKIDNDKLIKQTIFPTVQISAGKALGSGVVLYSNKTVENSELYENYCITAFHVLAEQIKERIDNNVKEDIKVKLFDSPGKDMEFIDAELVIYNPHIDAGLIKFYSDHKLYIANKATRDDLKNTKIFDRVLAVGCALGMPPLPSKGEISSLNKPVGRNICWIINAPIIYGNSGGGVFLKKGNKFIGIVSMICSYENFISIPVPHLGVIIPADKVYNWLDSHYYTFLYDSNISKDWCDKKRNSELNKTGITFTK